MPNPSILTSVINGYLPEPHASLLNGIIFGVLLKTSRIFYDQLRTVGLLHIVVLSSINIISLPAIIGLFTRYLSKPISRLITILSLFLFIAFIRPQAPIIQAGIMGILTFVAILFGKKSCGLYGLLLSIVFIAVFWPG